MKNGKRVACLVAAAITLSGASFLAQPAAASVPAAPCSASQLTFANGYADGYCAAMGYSDGSISSCTDNGNGTITISGSCS